MVSTFALPEGRILPESSTAEFNSDFQTGHVEEWLPEGLLYDSGKPRLGPCFRTSINIKGGASGGPVFDSDGNVIGICSEGMPPSKFFPDACSYVTCIQDILSLSLPDLKLEGETISPTIGRLHRLSYF